MSWPLVALFTSTTGDAADTSMTSVTPATARVNEIDVVCPARTSTAGRVPVWKPVNSTVMRYCADGASASRLATPWASVTALRLVMESVAVAVTVTPADGPRLCLRR